MRRIRIAVLATLVVCGCLVFAQQTGPYTKHVTVFGNSIAHFQAPFGPIEFPEVASGYTYIWGDDSFTCQDVLVTLLYMVPADTDILVLIDSSNDIRVGTPISTQLACMQQTIADLQNRNPDILIVVANTPPWTQYNPCTGQDNDPSIAALIEQYNAAYASEQWPAGVELVDVWTPMVETDGWAIPQLEIGPCGVHPGNEYQWSPAWAHFAAAYEVAVSQALQGQW